MTAIPSDLLERMSRELFHWVMVGLLFWIWQLAGLLLLMSLLLQ